jgi:glycosyltransferase involved in cell wall biosynthesis
MDKITFCIPSKSNLRYLKTCIPSIRKNAYRDDHEIIVFVDQDEDGTIKWLDEVKDQYNIQYYVNPKLGEELFGIGRAYDYCIAHSTTDIFMIFHADMMLGKHADLKAYNHLKEKTVVCSTRVEPPLHPNAGEKILLDFGMWPEEFKEEEFDKYVESQLEETKTTEGIFAPWMMYKEEFFAIGGHDPIMHSCREDSDIFNRMLLAEFNFIQPWNSLVYHLTGRGAGSFDGDEERHKQWQRDMNKSTLEFIRKWGSTVKHTPLMKPIVTSKYDIGLILKNIKENIIQALEPWCSNVYVDPLLGQNYIYNEDKNTSFDLKEKIKPLDNEKQNQILVEIDGNKFTQQDYQYIQQLPEILDNSTFLEEDYGDEFEVGNLRLTIIATDTFEKDLIKI